MALFVVDIEDEATLRMNEFFDYNGYCYGLSRRRTADLQQLCARLEDFYECTIRTDWVSGVLVVFTHTDENGCRIIGWYKSAQIYRQMQRISLFLEGNIKAKAIDAVLLKPSDRILIEPFDFTQQSYEVIEYDDSRYKEIEALIDGFNKETVPICYDTVNYTIDKNKIKAAGVKDSNRRQLDFKLMSQYCLMQCEMLAKRLMNDQCEDISELKALLKYGQLSALYDAACPDGHYYQAMACEQLGFIKQGLKAIDRALLLDGGAADLMAQKANLLIGGYKFDDAITLYEQAYSLDGDEDYLLMAGKAYGLQGNMEMAYKTFKRIKDSEILDSYGINLADIEKKWPFVMIRGFRLKKLLKKEY